MMRTIEIFLMIVLSLSFFSCSNKTARNVKIKADSLNTEPQKPKNFESIEQREWEEHRKDTLQNNKNSDTTIIKYKKPEGK